MSFTNPLLKTDFIVINQYQNKYLLVSWLPANEYMSPYEYSQTIRQITIVIESLAAGYILFDFNSFNIYLTPELYALFTLLDNNFTTTNIAIINSEMHLGFCTINQIKKKLPHLRVFSNNYDAFIWWRDITTSKNQY